MKRSEQIRALIKTNRTKRENIQRDADCQIAILKIIAGNLLDELTNINSGVKDDEEVETT
ncbi:MAG: hypothetical protein V1897_05600 [Pseudomonadota bacterium]